MKWEYHIVAISLENITETRETLNGLGCDGWELVAVMTDPELKKYWNYYCFKRSVPDKDAF